LLDALTSHHYAAVSTSLPFTYSHTCLYAESDGKWCFPLSAGVRKLPANEAIITIYVSWNLLGNLAFVTTSSCLSCVNYVLNLCDNFDKLSCISSSWIWMKYLKWIRVKKFVTQLLMISDDICEEIWNFSVKCSYCQTNCTSFLVFCVCCVRFIVIYSFYSKDHRKALVKVGIKNCVISIVLFLIFCVCCH